MRWWIKSIHFLQSDQELHRDVALPEQIKNNLFLKDIVFCMLKEISFPMEFLKGHYDSNDISSKDISFWMPRCVKGNYLSNEIFLKEHYLWSNIFKGHYFSKYILSKRIIFFERHFCQKTLSFKWFFFQRTLVFKYCFSKDIIL